MTRRWRLAPAVVMVGVIALSLYGCSSSSGGDSNDATAAASGGFTSPAITIDTDAASETIDQTTTYTADADVRVAFVLTEPLEYVAYQLEFSWDPSVLTLQDAGAPAASSVTCDEAPSAEESRRILRCRTTGESDDSTALATVTFRCASAGLSVIQLVPSSEDGAGTTIDVLPGDEEALGEFAVVSGVIACA